MKSDPPFKGSGTFLRGFIESNKLCSSQNIKHKTQVVLDHIFSLTLTILELIFDLESSV
jgi:hypothetical protein